MREFNVTFTTTDQTNQQTNKEKLNKTCKASSKRTHQERHIRTRLGRGQTRKAEGDNTKSGLTKKEVNYSRKAEQD